VSSDIAANARPPGEWMRGALEAAEHARGWSSPNPPVGAVVVRDGVIVGRGHTRPAGEAHAEVVALEDAGEAARGATVYCTLEPCAHQGRTPPCTSALIEAGVAAVHYAIADPHDIAAGGHAVLEAAGIAAEAGDGANEAREQLAGFLKHATTGRPRVLVKYAASLDGRIAAASGDSRWVSGPETLAWVHSWRPHLDGIVVGSSTVVVDDPELTARPGRASEAGPTEGAHQPVRIVVDSRGRTPASARILRGETPTLIATIEGSDERWRKSMRDHGAEIVELGASTGADGSKHVDLQALVQFLGDRGMLNVLFEGGGVLLGSLFDQRLVDRVYAVIAPVVIGAAEAPAAVAGRGVQRMAQAPRLTELAVERLGDDTLITGVPVWPSG
jgi:diaminohydroxyphosphoribosylaminopyrimidine deaminase/5-amino-6-(5-phosphoribosylamino)uracil reductase